ncbi:MAG TPA: hypothetical protein DD429_08555 [Clostridiaceae bacterium]|nr:hypothetical protein [Clostridiaceae bacterium]
MDKYYEQLTPAYKSKSYNLLKYIFYVMIAFSAFTILIVPPLGIIFVLLAVLLYFIKQTCYVEYEYTFTSGDVDMDKIIEAKKRKRIISFNMADIEILAPKGSSFLNDVHRGKEISAYPKDTDRKIYTVILSKNSLMQEISFIPDEEFINLCFRSNPKNVKK